MPSITQAWGALRATLQTFSFADIKTILGLAGFDMAMCAHLVQKKGDGTSKGQLLSCVDMAFGQMDEDGKKQSATILAEEILSRMPTAANQLEQDLTRLGWTAVQGVLLPFQLFDPRDVEDISDVALKEMVKASQRLRDGDLSGAISAACGAVDLVTTKVYRERSIGDHGAASFQERCRKSVDAMGVMGKLKTELQEIGWALKDVDMFERNLVGALNQGAYVMQSLRSEMGDVHGSKPVLKALVFDSIKWALLTIRTIESGDSTMDD